RVHASGRCGSYPPDSLSYPDIVSDDWTLTRGRSVKAEGMAEGLQHPDIDDRGNPVARSLVDPFDRAISYLRVSVTDRCDFRCVYCMSENMAFLPKADLLTLEELDRLCT